MSPESGSHHHRSRPKPKAPTPVAPGKTCGVVAAPTPAGGPGQARPTSASSRRLQHEVEGSSIGGMNATLRGRYRRYAARATSRGERGMQWTHRNPIRFSRSRDGVHRAGSHSRAPGSGKASHASRHQCARIVQYSIVPWLLTRKEGIERIPTHTQ
jgi:hypothetical protein